MMAETLFLVTVKERQGFFWVFHCFDFGDEGNAPAKFWSWSFMGSRFMGMELVSIVSIMEQWIWINPFASPTDHSSVKESHSEEMDNGTNNNNIALTMETNLK